MTDYTKLIERLRNVESPICLTAADAIEALQVECAEHKENAMRNARIAVNIRAQLEAMQRQEPVAPEQIEAAWRAGWAACRDAEYVGQEAENEAWGMSQTCASADWENASPKAMEPLTAKDDWDIRGILASKLRVFHRTTEAEADELISLFASMKSHTPLTQPEVVEAFCNTRHNVQYVSVFDAGVRFAEKHYGIGGTP